MKAHALAAIAVRHAIALAAVSMFVSSIDAAVNYELVDLGIPARFSESHATAINSNGVVTVTAKTGGTSQAYFYDAGSLHPITVPGATNTVASGLNDNGLFVGTANFLSPSPTLGYIYDVNTSSITTIASPFSDNGTADRVNNNGIVLGYANLHAPGGYLYQGGTYTQLDNETGYLGGYGELNRNNQVLASSSTLQAYYVYDLGSGPLSATTGTLNWNLYTAQDFNDQATIAGFIQANQDLFLTTPSSNLNNSTTDKGRIGLGITGVGDINNLDAVVGTFDIDGATDHPFLFSNNHFVDLNDVISAALGWTLENATGINDQGQIVGTGLAADGLQHAYLLNPTLSPVPEPAMYGLAGVGMLMLASLRRRLTRRKSAAL
jgi:probable HAF family extracellular repeat protein